MTRCIIVVFASHRIYDFTKQTQGLYSSDRVVFYYSFSVWKILTRQSSCKALQVQYHPQHYFSKCPNMRIAAFLLGINSFKICHLESSLWFISYLLSPFLRSYRVVRASATWWLSAHWGRRAGCRLLSPPRTPQDMCSRMRAFHPSPLTKSKSGFTTTREKARLVQWPPSTQRRKVCTITTTQKSTLTLCRWSHSATTDQIDFYVDFNLISCGFIHTPTHCTVMHKQVAKHWKCSSQHWLSVTQWNSYKTYFLSLSVS